MKKHILMSLSWLLIGVALVAKTSIAGYPFAAYSHETRIMGGAFAFVKHDLHAATDLSKHSLSLLSNTIYTQNKQFMIVLMPEYENDGFRVGSDLFLFNWPEKYYGIGNSTNKDVSESYVSKSYTANTTVSKSFNNNVGISLRSSLGQQAYRKIVPGGMLESDPSINLDKVVISGIGYSIDYETAEKGYSPTKGIRLEIRQMFYDEALGSDVDFVESRYDARAYVPLQENHVLAFQSDMSVNTGDVPWSSFPELGNRLRAYDSKRFTDKVRISQRVEQRIFPFSGKALERLGFVTFAETGQVSPAVEDIRIADWHWSVGAGLRFTMLPKEKLNLRIDFGFGDDSFNFIVNAREVF